MFKYPFGLQILCHIIKWDLEEMIMAYVKLASWYVPMIQLSFKLGPSEYRS